jgi:hypothetical protein
LLKDTCPPWVFVLRAFALDKPGVRDDNNQTSETVSPRLRHLAMAVKGRSTQAVTARDSEKFGDSVTSVLGGVRASNEDGDIVEGTIAFH